MFQFLQKAYVKYLIYMTFEKVFIKNKGKEK